MPKTKREGEYGIGQFVKDLPKAELHVHLEGTLEPELKFALAKRNGLKLRYDNIEAMREGYVFTDPKSFLSAFYEGASVLVTEADFRDLTYAYLQRAHQDNIVYAELMLDPQSHRDRGVHFESLIEGVRDGQMAARNDFGVRSQLILCLMREKSVDSALQIVHSSVRYADCVAGIGLVGIEPGNPPVKFREVFAKARSEGFRLSAHCGPDVEGVVDHIWQCVRDIEIDRIDHGVNAVEDVALMEAIAHKGLCLNVCPIRRAAQSWVGPRHAKNIRELMDAGIIVTINTDDPAYFLSRYLNDVLLDLEQTLTLTEADVLELIRNAFRNAWLSSEQRTAYLMQLDAAAATM